MLLLHLVTILIGFGANNFKPLAPSDTLASRLKSYISVGSDRPCSLSAKKVSHNIRHKNFQIELINHWQGAQLL